MSTPSLGEAAGLGFRAVLREAWLLAPGIVVGGARRFATVPAFAVLWILAVRAALHAARSRPFDPTALAEGAFDAVSSPRAAALLLGLWASGALLAAALRVAWVAGAIPTLGGAISGAARGPRFATGLVWNFPPVLATAALALVAEVAGALFAWTVLLAAIRITVHAASAGGSPLLAAAVAAALTLGVAVPAALSAVADAAVARAALRGERPGLAFAGAVLRLLSRPGSFLLGGLAFALVAAAAPMAVQSFAGIATGFARGVSPLVLAGPELMLALAAAGIAAAVDLWWLGTVSVLACGGEVSGRGAPPVPTRG